MVRGTTAQFKFKLPYEKSELAEVIIKFWQPGMTLENLPITRTLDHCSENIPKELCVSLDATETLWFSDKVKAKVQLRARTNDGTAFASHQHSITVYPINDDIIIDDELGSAPIKDGWVVLDGKPIVLQGGDS